MTPTKHTPGPWNLCKSAFVKGGFNIHHYGPAHGKSGNAEDCPTVVDGYIRNESDARLIAAAPEMLKALEEITDELENQYDSCNAEESSFEKERLRLVTNARSAIAKAEGLKS